MLAPRQSWRNTGKAMRRSSRISVEEENSWGKKGSVGEETPSIAGKKKHVILVHDLSLQ